jgi:uncharacterized protein YecE (DUF72 family)
MSLIKESKARPKKGIWVGTSGWTYDGWRGPFYPAEVPKKEWLAWYATRFASAEVNFSFYRTPSLEAVRGWRQQTPADFLFAWKASKFITHWKRLNEHTCQNSLDLMATRLKALGRKAGPVLFQLPPQFAADPVRLERFLRLLPRHYLHAFEFRHPSWYARDVLQVLRDHNVSLCISDHHHAPAPWMATAKHVYIRGHGPDGRYKDHYSDATLAEWSKHIRKWRRQGKMVFAFFDNDQKSAAPVDARRLMTMLRISAVKSAGRNILVGRNKAMASSRP